jgi:quercetin dioxygenase-like cupin family protein
MKRKNFLISSLLALPFISKAKKIYREKKGFFIASGKTRLEKPLVMVGQTLNSMDIKISTGDTDGDQLLIEQTGNSLNVGPPLHVHHFQDEYVYVLEGEYLFQVGEEKHKMKVGDTIFLPRAVPHAFIQLTKKARFLLSYQPAGKMESFFTTMASQKKAPTPDEIKQIFEDHDMKVVGGRVKND